MTAFQMLHPKAVTSGHRHGYLVDTIKYRDPECVEIVELLEWPEAPESRGIIEPMLACWFDVYKSFFEKDSVNHPCSLLNHRKRHSNDSQQDMYHSLLLLELFCFLNSGVVSRITHQPFDPIWIDCPPMMQRLEIAFTKLL